MHRRHIRRKTQVCNLETGSLPNPIFFRNVQFIPLAQEGGWVSGDCQDLTQLTYRMGGASLIGLANGRAIWCEKCFPCVILQPNTFLNCMYCHINTDSGLYYAGIWIYNNQTMLWDHRKQVGTMPIQKITHLTLQFIFPLPGVQAQWLSHHLTFGTNQHWEGGCLQPADEEVLEATVMCLTWGPSSATPAKSIICFEVRTKSEKK